MATGAALSLASLLLIARIIGPEASGIAAVAIAGFLLADLACASLFTDALVQRRGLSAAEAGAAATAQAGAGLAGAALLALAAPLLARAAGEPGVAPLVQALAPLLPLSAISGAAAGLALRDQRHRLLAARVLVGQPLGLLAGVLVARAGFGPWAVVAQQAGATLAAFALMLAAAGRFGLRPRLDRTALAALWPVAGPQVLALLVSAGRYRLFVLALGIATAETVLALANMAFRLLDAALLVVLRASARLGLPRLAALQHDRAALAEAYGQLAQLHALAGMPVALGIALTAPDLVAALLGPAWGGAAAAAQIAGLAAAAMLLCGDAGSLFVAVGRTRRNLWTAAAALAVPVAAVTLLRPGTPAGVALCWAAATGVLLPVQAVLVLRELRRPLSWLLRRVAPALLAGAAMAAAMLALQPGLGATGLSAAARVAAQAVLGAAVYGAVAWLALGRRVPVALAGQPAAAARSSVA